MMLGVTPMPFPAAYGNFSDLFIVRFVPPASLPTYRKRQVTEIFETRKSADDTRGRSDAVTSS